MAATEDRGLAQALVDCNGHDELPRYADGGPGRKLHEALQANGAQSLPFPCGIALPQVH